MSSGLKKKWKNLPVFFIIKESKSTGVASVLNIESGTEVLLAHLTEPGQGWGAAEGTHVHFPTKCGINCEIFMNSRVNYLH